MSFAVDMNIDKNFNYLHFFNQNPERLLISSNNKFLIIAQSERSGVCIGSGKS